MNLSKILRVVGGGGSRLVLASLCLFAAVSARAEKRVIAYVPNWTDLPTLATTIDYAKLTHINIAFENPTNSDGGLSFNSKNEALIARAKANSVKVLISIGGGGAADNATMKARYFSLISADRRKAFASRLANYVEAHGFDGLDVDIEGPSINEDYGAFIAELGAVLKPKGKLLTSALSKGYGGDRVPASTFEHFDFVNIMAYDGTGPWDPKRVGQHSSFEYAQTNVAYWLKRGLSKDKAVLGVPFYGYGFGEAFKKGDYPYSRILKEFPGAETKDEVGNTVWYNGIPTIRAKSRYVVENDLGGVMIWSLDYDVPGEKSLLSAIHSELTKRPQESSR